MSKTIGVLTTGGDSPGINAALRGLGKAATGNFNMKVIGYQDGFTGMATDMSVHLESGDFSGILTTGGTILGTNRDRPNKVFIDGKPQDSTQIILETYKKQNLDALVCLGGGDAQESAFYLMSKGLNVITLPVTIDNDIPHSDTSVGYDTAVEVAAEAIDRLHSTAISHHRIIIVEMMGAETGWLTLAAGIAGGADVILIPEIPYNIQKVSQAILDRSKQGKRFSLVAVSEGAISEENVRFFEGARKANQRLRDGNDEAQVNTRLAEIEKSSAGDTIHLANRLEQFTNLETRITILGYLQRGGTPSATDRVLATQLGTACATLINDSRFGVMVAAHSDGIQAIPLDQVAGKVKTVPLDHAWISGARLVGVSFGD
jgi:ATP-dependent phosphofructokinase / diphosphate-dependent phosphofructokinase